MNETWVKLVSCDQDVTNVMKWWLVKKAPKKYVRMAMLVGGVREVVQETCLTILQTANPPNVTCHWSTAAINQTRWTLLRMFKQWTAKAVKEAVFLHESSHDLTVANEQVAIAIRKELAEQMSICMEILNYREKIAIDLRMQDMTFDEVGHVLKVTRERVRQIAAKAIRKLQEPSVAQNLFEFLDE